MSDRKAGPGARASLTAATLALALGACSFTDPSRVEKDFGNSVRQMVQAQLYDPQAASEPAAAGVDLLDGDAGASAIDGYRANAKTSRDNTTTPEAGRVTLTVPEGD